MPFSKMEIFTLVVFPRVSILSLNSGHLQGNLNRWIYFPDHYDGISVA
jgi:hypothetical protein